MKKIPIGIENFKEMIDGNYYCVDKSEFIEIAMEDKVSLFTRPRRFGKTLNMSMLYYFLSNKEKENAYLFNELNISRNQEMMNLQNKFPVISISFKELNENTYESAINQYRVIISNLFKKFSELKHSPALDDVDLKIYNSLREMNSSEVILQSALLYLTNFLEAHYHQKVILLIDEYDVPLQAAYKNNYYEAFVTFLKSCLSSVLKTNDSLYRGIMTGCLRVAKESIFTGLNNFSVYSILDNAAAQCFGFTHDEIQDILEEYQLQNHFLTIKEWYDGYLFGNIEIYNPWSTLYYVKNQLRNNGNEINAYWANTSSNDVVYHYIKNSDSKMREEFEQLVQGKTLTKYIYPELTYREMDQINHIYSFLLLTGYLRIKKSLGKNEYELMIPNQEVRDIYENHFMNYFDESIKDLRNEFLKSLHNEDVTKANYLLNEILSQSVSFYDNYESFYHEFMIGLLGGQSVKSNREMGNGRSDLAILPANKLNKSIIIEFKKADRF